MNRKSAERLLEAIRFHGSSTLIRLLDRFAEHGICSATRYIYHSTDGTVMLGFSPWDTGAIRLDRADAAALAARIRSGEVCIRRLVDIIERPENSPLAFVVRVRVPRSVKEWQETARVQRMRTRKLRRQGSIPAGK